MGNRTFIRSATVAALVLLGAGWASAADDLETDLLKKFQKQNQKSAQQVKLDVEKNVAEAALLSPLHPERALDLLRQSRELLAESDKMPKADREALARKLDDGFRDAKARLESMMAARNALVSAKPQDTTPPISDPYAAKDKKPAVAGGPIVLNPIMGQVPISATATVTPVVSADRRWVRIGVRGTFSGLTGVQMTPIQIGVPNLLYGPRGGFILVP